MEAILTLGIIGVIFFIFRKLLSIIASSILIFIISSLVALFTDATIITSILMVCAISIVLKLALRSFFNIFRKVLRRTKRYREGLLEKIVDILFSVNIALMSVIWTAIIIYVSVIYNFDTYYLLETTIYAAATIKILSIFEKKVVGK